MLIPKLQGLIPCSGMRQVSVFYHHVCSHVRQNDKLGPRSSLYCTALSRLPGQFHGPVERGQEPGHCLKAKVDTTGCTRHLSSTASTVRSSLGRLENFSAPADIMADELIGLDYLFGQSTRGGLIPKGFVADGPGSGESPSWPGQPRCRGRQGIRERPGDILGTSPLPMLLLWPTSPSPARRWPLSFFYLCEYLHARSKQLLKNNI